MESHIVKQPSQSTRNMQGIPYPELVFAIAGPIGVDINAISEVLKEELYRVRYNTHFVRLTSAMEGYPIEHNRPKGVDYYEEMMRKMDYGNALCRKHDAAVMARIGIKEIYNKRESIINNDLGKKFTRSESEREKPIPQSVAYVIRQLKRPEEVNILRSVYGKQFILISAYGPVDARKSRLEEKIRNSASTLLKPTEVSERAEKLIERDASEDDEKTGQQLRETFHLADVFIDGISKQNMRETIERFVQALFGRTDKSPTKNEYGMYAAKSASLRSADLSRQVGAAIFSNDGELITQGRNEVPKALGGTYWDNEEPDFRDVKIGNDPNNSEKNHILRDIFERLLKENLLSDSAKALGSPADMVKAATTKASNPNQRDGALVGSRVQDLTEFGRIVHAEMCAICDAARIGRSIKGSTLFCTTFPCHNCAKHIIASGINKVIYMEPYPKSMAPALHENEISVEQEVEGKVSFLPFLGISPYRYRDIFQKGKRKAADGTAVTWYNDQMRPMIDVAYPSYPEAEKASIAGLFVEIVERSGRHTMPRVVDEADQV